MYIKTKLRMLPFDITDPYCSSMFLFTKARIAEKQFHRWLSFFIILCLNWMKFFSTGVLIFYQPTY